MVPVPGAPDEEIPGMAITAQINTALANDFICQFINRVVLSDHTIVPDLYAGAFGGEWTMETCLEMSKETLKIERMFNERAGFTSADDRLPDFFRQPGYEGGPVFHYTDEQVQLHMNVIHQYR
jgi:aldehyde:ferredoxin oxidoreductase